MTTRLDDAHAAMQAAPDDDAARLRFFERLSDAELFLLLEREPERDKIDPRVFPTADGDFVLVFDRDWRLSEFAGEISPYAALSGRSIATMLAGQSIGLGLNLGVAPSSILIPADGVAWMRDVLARRPSEVEDTPQEVFAPTALPDALITAIDEKLAATAGMADAAYLNLVVWNGGRRGHLLSFVAALPGSEPALASAVGEALIFSGVDAGELDVSFFGANDPVTARLAANGLRFDLPKLPERREPGAPGMDPDRPPKLI